MVTLSNKILDTARAVIFNGDVNNTTATNQGATAMTVRTPTDKEWTHEAARIDGFQNRCTTEDQLNAAILRRAATIKNAQKLYNFIRALEDQNFHRINSQVIQIYETQFGFLPSC